jgi:hypothetical protein
MDPYAYVGGNPESRTDPTGNRPICGDPGEACNDGGGGSSGGGIDFKPPQQNNGGDGLGSGGGSTTTPTPTPTPSTSLSKRAKLGSSVKLKCAFMCGNVNGSALAKGIGEFLGGAIGLGVLIALFNGGLAVTGGLAILAANYIKSAIVQAVRLILVGFQDIFDSAAEHNPWVDVVLDSLKIVTDVLTLVFSISDTTKLISNIRNGSGLLGKAKFLLDEAGDFFAGQGTSIKSHAGLIVSANAGFVAAAVTLLGGEGVPDSLQFAGDLQNALNY